MEGVKIDGQQLKDLVQRRLHGGVPELQARWDKDGGLHRATVYRWFNGGLPKSSADLLKLCSIIDVDPFSLLIPDGRGILESADSLVYAYQNDHWKPALSFLRDFLGRHAEWPPSSVSSIYYGRDWHTQDISHQAVDPEINFYEVRSNVGYS